jgi:hypothetical protein
MTPLTLKEKQLIARTFRAFEVALKAGASNIETTFKDFQLAYRGESRAYVDSFKPSEDGRQWAGQLEMYLLEEIGADPEVWIPGYGSGAKDEGE